MIPGYNHNVKYKDRVFHVQTEDSGVDNPHIITHLFVGGNIIESRKTSYADIVANENLKEMLVELMQDQHKGMLKDLISGRIDDKVVTRSVNAATLNGPAPLNVEAGAQHRASFGIGTPLTQPKAPPPAAAPTPGVPPPVTKAPPPPLNRPPAFAGAPLAAPKPAAAPPPPAAVAARTPAAPAPGGQSERIIEAETLQRAFDSKNDYAVDSIFGEDLISEKSLDEVILSYLAEDMQKE
jgi:hypothetical protein